MRQYPRGGSLQPSAYGGGGGGGTDEYSRDIPADRPEGDRFTPRTNSGSMAGQDRQAPQQLSQQSAGSTQQGSFGSTSGPFQAASQGQGGFPDKTDSEASDAESVRQALAHARLRSRELDPGTGQQEAAGGPTSGLGGLFPLQIPCAGMHTCLHESCMQYPRNENHSCLAATQAK